MAAAKWKSIRAKWRRFDRYPPVERPPHIHSLLNRCGLCAFCDWVSLFRFNCVLFLPFSLLYVHFIGRRKNRLPDLPRTSTTARFWNELDWEEGGTRDLETIRVRIGGEAEKLLAQHGQRGEEGDESADSL
ncbi:hypothetical protein GPALN_016355 [Globodera pallida]|nr:hypothetical protein GPALN_016355 [Globodera pallida]